MPKTCFFFLANCPLINTIKVFIWRSTWIFLPSHFKTFQIACWLFAKMWNTCPEYWSDTFAHKNCCVLPRVNIIYKYIVYLFYVVSALVCKRCCCEEMTHSLRFKFICRRNWNKWMRGLRTFMNDCVYCIRSFRFNCLILFSEL